MFGYVGLLGLTSVAATTVFKGQSGRLEKLNQRLLESNQRESSLAARMADQVQELSIFGSVVDHSIVGVSIADMRQPDEPLIYVNKAFTMITGYSRELAIGYNCRFLQGPETDRKEVDRIRAAIHAGRPYSGELINYRLDGSRFWNRLTLYPVGGSGGPGSKPDFYVSNQVDISHIKQNTTLSDDQISSLTQAVEDAQQALSEAMRFRDALKIRLQAAAGGGLQVEEEALLQAELQAQERLVQALQSIQKWSDERGPSL